MFVADYAEGVAQHSPGSLVFERTLGDVTGVWCTPQGFHKGTINLCNPCGVVADEHRDPRVRSKTSDPGLCCPTPSA